MFTTAASASTDALLVTFAICISVFAVTYPSTPPRYTPPLSFNPSEAVTVVPETPLTVNSAAPGYETVSSFLTVAARSSASTALSTFHWTVSVFSVSLMFSLMPRELPYVPSVISMYPAMPPANASATTFPDILP